jgi:dolichol-phosphate mannosyltransferase
VNTIVVIPTYNEKDNLHPILDRLFESVPDAHALIVDDSSPDGTGELADARAAIEPRLHVLHRTGKEGLGKAYLAGFAWALEHDYEVIVEMDADGSHHPEQLPQLLALAHDDDLILGSRWVPGGSVENWPLSRKVLSQGGNLYARLALGVKVRDATGGFRVFTRRALEKLDLDGVASHGYCFQIDLVWRALQAGLRVVEHPITFTERIHGESKMDSSIVSESLLRVTIWGLRRRARGVVEVVAHHRRLPSVRDTSRVAFAPRQWGVSGR